MAQLQAIFSPTVLDVEASGFGRNSYPIEIGFVLPDGHTFCTLVRPEPHWTHWDAQAEGLHRISRALIEARGLPVPEVAQALNKHQEVPRVGAQEQSDWRKRLHDDHLRSRCERSKEPGRDDHPSLEQLRQDRT